MELLERLPHPTIHCIICNSKTENGSHCSEFPSFLYVMWKVFNQLSGAVPRLWRIERLRGLKKDESGAGGVLDP
jgi:hypothetical protein